MEFDLSKNPTKPKSRGLKPIARTGFLVVLLLVMLFLLFFFLNFQTVVVQGHSMEDTLHNGDHILVCKALWLVSIKKGDIIVIKGEKQGEYLVKRVYAMEGEPVDYSHQPKSWDFTEGQFVVPAGHIYVLGDNEEVSEDSRSFGPVPESQILGKVIER